MKEAGMLRGRPFRLIGKEFYKGDRLLLTETSRKFGVNNGEIGTIVGLHEKKGEKIFAVKLDRGKIVYIPTSHYFGFDHGYAVTTHKGQGSTVERAYILAGGSMQDKEIS
jgi:ATP-dependent exoDNAse (exonuclease V) alpha subunit